MPVVTVTLNPAIDQTIHVDRLTHGQVHRGHDVRFDAGGKGINVASCLADFGVPVIATGLLGQDNAVPFETLFAAKDIVDRCVRVPGATRTNLKIVDSVDTTDVNLPGLVATEAALDAVATRLDTAATTARLIVLAGSLPTGCSTDHYATLLTRLGDARVVLDASGAALQAALAGPVLPFCVKPNRHELAEWAGHAVDDLASVVAQACQLHAAGIALVVVSLGEQGAVFHGSEGTLIARLAADVVTSTVGAGDSMVAGIASALHDGADLETIARRATAFAVAKLGRAGPNLPDRETVRALNDAVSITRLSPSGEAV
ncbi:1-phosphofructokinase [Sphingomonas sp. PB2P12]|uniref:1-phosphofructokinase n=1 Tax=Sphingomonas sandaracina TaxID=3096157 RepID=UPI002FC76566